MRSIQLFCFLILSLAFAGCSQKSATDKAANMPAVEQPSKPATPVDKSQGGHDYTFLTVKMLQYRAALVPGKDPKEQPFTGHWIKLDSDGTFRSGIYDKQTHTGKWVYNHEATTLMLQPDTKDFKTTEWKVIFNDDMIVFIGTASYGDSGTQIQLTRIDKFPVKQ